MYILQGKNQPTRHTFSILNPRMVHDHTYLTWSTYSNLSYSHGGYNLEGAGLPHTHSPTFLISCPYFSLMAPPGLYFNQILAKNQSVEFLKNLWSPRGLSTTRPSTVAYIYA
jgi:hypothetical protein